MMLWFEPQLSYRKCNFCTSCSKPLKIPALCNMLIACCIKSPLDVEEDKTWIFPINIDLYICYFMLCMMRILKEIS